jgi:dihydroorotate dehydrogenase electron transfer subunit
MMEVVARLCKKYKVPAELSLERYMKCGFGVCGQCACGNKLVCADGCIFSGEEALSLEDFGQFHRGPEGQKEYF